MEKNVSYSFEESSRFKLTNMTSQSINGTKNLPIIIRKNAFDVEKYLKS